MFITNYHVTETENGLFFDEDFNMADFTMHFQVDPEDDVSPSGWVVFRLTEHTASAELYYYSHPEDLSPSIDQLDVMGCIAGRAIMCALHEYSLRKVYDTAKAFTKKAVNDHIAEVERVWREYMERA